jgi:uncharacterized membrane protein
LEEHMSTEIERLRTLQYFLLCRSLGPLVLASMLSCGILAGRIYLSHSLGYAHLVWNLFLAWIPYFCSLWVARIDARYPNRLWRLLIPGALWLLFFPNAPYLVTDFVHILYVPPLALWYDVGLLLAFSWTGYFLAVASLRTMQMLVRAYVGTFGSWLFVVAIAMLSGFGVYLGRFLRWNSWDILLNPRGVAAGLLALLTDGVRRRQTFGVTCMSAVLLLVCYLMLTTAHHEPPARRRG